jgi:hypothetical protein
MENHRAGPGPRPAVQVGHLEHVLTIEPAIVRGFAEAVADSLQGGVLPYSDRQRLLRRAARLGIGRFDANLIIASVQHRRPACGDERALSIAPETGWKSALLIVLTIEATLAGVFAWLFVI